MNKEQSLSLKGVAILFMLYLHLFNNFDNVSLLTDLYICSKPLSLILSRATNPVPFFMILSGYGLYVNGGGNNLKRVLRLYEHYWITMLVFIPLGFLFVDRVWSAQAVIENITAYNTTWYGEAWFILPYSMMILSCPLLFKLINKFNSVVIAIVSFVISLVTGFLISRYGTSYIYPHHIVHVPLMYTGLLFSFVIGAVIAKEGIISKIKLNSMLAAFLLIVLVVLRCCFKTGALHSVYAVLFILLFSKIQLPNWSVQFLKEMGKRSTSMWLVHTYFCYYYLHDWIYSFKYPFLVFVMLLTVSYLSAVVIDWMFNKVKLLEERNV